MYKCLLIPLLLGLDWIIGDVGASCTKACEDRGMYCKNTELERHNDEVDSPEKVLEMILKLQPDFNLTATGGKCNSAYGKSPAQPSFSSELGFCLSSSSAIDKTYDCDAIPYPLNQKKARLCYCKEGKVEQHLCLLKMHCDRNMVIICLLDFQTTALIHF